MVDIDGKHRIFRKKKTKYDVLEYSKYPYTPKQTEEVCQLIRDNLTENLLPDNIKKKYPPEHTRWNYPHFGYCVPATFTLLYVMDTNVLEPMRGEDETGELHWWLRDILTREKYDITLAQFPTYEDLEKVYATGKPTGYYGGRNPNYQMPASRWFDLIQKIQPTSTRWDTLDIRYNPPSLEEFY